MNVNWTVFWFKAFFLSVAALAGYFILRPLLIMVVEFYRDATFTADQTGLLAVILAGVIAVWGNWASRSREFRFSRADKVASLVLEYSNYLTSLEAELRIGEMRNEQESNEAFMAKVRQIRAEKTSSDLAGNEAEDPANDPTMRDPQQNPVQLKRADSDALLAAADILKSRSNENFEESIALIDRWATYERLRTQIALFCPANMISYVELVDVSIFFDGALPSHDSKSYREFVRQRRLFLAQSKSALQTMRSWWPQRLMAGMMFWTGVRLQKLGAAGLRKYPAPPETKDG